jgi:uracil-DNA glycosylase family 4
MKSLINAITGSRSWRGSPSLYKTAEERLFLYGWINKAAISPPEINDESVIASIENCNKCKNVKERKKGFGTGANRFMVLLNAPQMMNRIEMSLHRSESVDLLKKMLKAIGLELAESYTTNLIKCESTDPFTKPSDMLKNCLGILEKEIVFFNPEIILVMGDIIPLQGIVKGSSGITWFNTDHPVSILKNPDLKRPAWETLKLVKNRYAELKK